MLDDGLANLDVVTSYLSAGEKPPKAIASGRGFVISKGDMLYIPAGWVALVMGASENHASHAVIDLRSAMGR